MADILKVYQGENVVAEAERAKDGTATVTIDGLDPSTEYAAGTYQATFSNDAGESAKVDVPAFTTKDVSVTGVTVAQDAHEVEVGGTTQIKATVEPSDATDKKVSYKSSDDKVATVDDSGVVTGVKAGSAEITVTTNDGEKTAVSTITVTAKTIAVTGVTLDKSTLSLEVGSTATLNATIAPSNASYKTVKFTSSDDAIATVDDKGKVTAVKAGTADITVESLADGSKTAKCELTVTAAAPAKPQNVTTETTEDTADVSAE